jgi:hypothetical protein
MKTLEVKNLDLHASDPHQNNFNAKRFYEQLYKTECCSMSFSESFELTLLEHCMKNYTFVYHSGFTMSVSSLDKELNVKNILSNIDKKKQPNFYFFDEEYIMVLALNDRNEKYAYYGDDDYDYMMPDTNTIVAETSEEQKENRKK